MNVPFLDLKAQTQELKTELATAYERVIESGWFLQGHELSDFESAFAAYCDAPYCVGVGNGLDALHLILRAHGIGPGDEVIVPANTFIATWLAVSYCGATPVAVEPDVTTYNIDPESIAAAISPATRAIMPVHLYGQPADMDAINTVAAAHDIIVIEDAAQAHGATYKGRKTGSLGHAAGFSFYPAKNMGALGDAGAVVTTDESIADKVRMLGNYGSVRKYEHVDAGFNSRMDELQAAFLGIKLKSIEKWNARRRQIADMYLQGLSDTGLVLPTVMAETDPVWHLFVVRSSRREDFTAYLEGRGVQTMIHYPTAPHMQGAYKDAGYRHGNFPVTESLQQEILSLPLHPHLSDDEVAYVIQCCRDFKV